METQAAWTEVYNLLAKAMKGAAGDGVSRQIKNKE